MPDLNPHIGLWASGAPIDITGVPLVMSHDGIGALYLRRAFDAVNGGMFIAEYRYAEKRANGTAIYYLVRVEEIMPPRPPQIQGFGDDVRLPMMEQGGFSAHLEAEQRKKEWAEARVA